MPPPRGTVGLKEVPHSLAAIVTISKPKKIQLDDTPDHPSP